MSWLSEERLALLVTSTMLNSSISEEERKGYEKELRFEREHAMNIGDCIVSLVRQTYSNPVVSDESSALSLAVAMLLEGMIEQGWREGTCFSDKPMVMKELYNLCSLLAERLSSSPDRSMRKLFRVISQCISKVCVVEYPSDIWDDFIESQTQQIHSDEASQCLLVELSSIAHENVDLWCFLSSTVLPTILQAHPQVPLFVLRPLTRLMSRKPPTSQIADADSNPLICTGQGIAAMLLDVFQSRGLDFLGAVNSSELDSPVDFGLASELEMEELLVGVLWRYPLLDELHGALLSACFERLAIMSDVYSTINEGGVSGTLGFALVNYSTELLEAVHSVYTFWDGGYTLNNTGEVFNVLLPFLVDVYDGDGVGSDEQLLNDALDEDTIVAGGGSGSPSNLSTSIIQLFIEFDAQTLLEFSNCWHSQAEKVTPNDMQGFCRCWYALGMALTAMAKQCDVEGISLLDTVPDSTSVFLTPLGNVLNNMESVPAELTAKLLTVLGSTMKLSQDAECCRQALLYVIDVIEAQTDDRPSNIASAAVLAASKVLTASVPACEVLHKEIPPSVVEAALWVGSNAGALGAFCGTNTLITLIELCPQLRDAIWSGDSLLCVTRSLINESGNVSFSTLLNKLIGSLIDEHGNQYADRIGQLCELVLHQAETDYTHPTCRVAADALHLLTLDKSFAILPVASELATLVCKLLLNGPHEAALLRCYAVALATFVACPGFENINFANHLLEAAQKLLTEAATMHHNSATLSTVCSAMGIVVLRCDLIDGDSSFFDHCIELVMEHVANKGKDYNYSGLCFFAAALADRFGVREYCSSIDRRSGDDDKLQELADFFSLWLALLPHCDRRTQNFSVVSLVELVRVVMSGGSSDSVARFFSTPETILFRRIPSHHTKMASKIPVVHVSVLEGVRLSLSMLAFEKQLNIKAMKIANFMSHAAFDNSLPLSGLHESETRNEVLERGLVDTATHCLADFCTVYPAGTLDSQLSTIDLAPVEQYL